LGESRVIRQKDIDGISLTAVAIRRG